MATRVLLTVDTELVWRHHAAGLGWQENFKRSYDPAGVGIPHQLKLLADHDLKACFFVDPMPALVHGLDPIRRMVDPILAAGQEVQLHIHPFWAHLAEAEEGGERRELAAFDLEAQRALILQARDLLVAAGAPSPIAFRAGSYAANAATLEALASLGIRFDSSHNGSQPGLSQLPFHPTLVTPRESAGIIEIPVSQIEELPGRLRHLQICAVSLRELTRALVHAAREGHPVTTVVSHSFELATRDGLRPNGVVYRRFLGLCRFLADRRDSMPTAWFSDLDTLELDADGQPLSGGATPRLGRIASQAWGDARYERRTTAAVAASAAAASVMAALADVG
jgi:peptidoglycan/xylan/chitin deacetylase (PgdA/CDA1 family)